MLIRWLTFYTEKSWAEGKYQLSHVMSFQTSNRGTEGWEMPLNMPLSPLYDMRINYNYFLNLLL